MQNQKTEIQKSVPAYQKLVDGIKAACAEMEIPVKSWELKNFVGFESEVNGHKLYVPKHAGDVGYCHTTLMIERDGDLVTDLPKGPGTIGKIETFVAPDLDLISDRVLPLFTASESRLRANRKPTRKATPGQGTPATEPKAPDYTFEDVAGDAQ